LEHNFLVTCISTPVAVKLRLSLNINHGIIILVAKVLVTARDTQYHFCFKRNYMADEMSVPGVNPTEEQIAFTMGALQDKLDQANKYYDKVMSKITKLKDKSMAEVMSPGGIMMGGGDGGLGFGSGGGLIGGLILGSLLRNGNGGLFGGGADGAAGAVLRAPPEQATANIALMQSIGAVDKAVAVSTAAMEASQANQTIGLTNQFNSVTGSLASRIEGVKDTVNANAMVLAQQIAALSQTTMENRYELSKDISADGEKTRALITNQYEINLQRQLSDANAAIIELRGDSRLAERTRGIEVNTTTTVNQMQQQSQQQAQYGQLANMIWALGQNIRNDNAAINVGSGTQTSTPTNTNTNIR
jgi:hypothetical protein